MRDTAQQQHQSSGQRLVGIVEKPPGIGNVKGTPPLSLAGQGIEKIGIEDGLQAFSDLLRTAPRSGPAQVGVWRVNWPAFQRRLPSGETPPFLGALVRRSPQSSRSAISTDEFLSRFHSAHTGERVALLEASIQKELLEVLGQEASHEIPPTQSWADLAWIH